MKKLTSLLYSLSILLVPTLAQACTVCFGGVGSDLSRGFFWGIVILGSLPFILIGMFVGFLITTEKKKRAAEKSLV